MDDLLRDFLTESAESLTVVDAELVRLESDPNNKDVLQKIFRLVHTIKGTCGFIGLPRLEKVAHHSENILGKFRDGEMLVTPEAVTLILESLDLIKEILTKIEQTESEPQGNDTDLIERLERAAEGDFGGGAQSLPQASGLVATQTFAANAAAATAGVAEKGDAPEAQAAGGGKGGETSLANQSIRVNVDVIENLIVMVSELVLTRNQLLEMVRHTSDSEFKSPLSRLSTVTAELQEGVMKTRMQPIGNAWAKLPRIVRDLATEVGKKIDLQMVGAETELDRQVLELIKDPLTHMIRNSADHGIETPAERKAAGKPELGTITLRAYHEGGHILIQIADDGKGLPTDKIKAKAAENGIASEAELDRMSEAQIHRLIFHAGLSTATKVTNVSGRGVGMDVVRSNIELIGGSIDLKSVCGKGSTFTIKIPLTLAIVSALIVGVQEMRFAIPQLCVTELVRAGEAREAKVEWVNRTPVLRLRDRLLPLVRLSDVLNLASGDSERRDMAFIVVAQAAGRSFGIIVDEVFDTGEIVVKPMSPALRDVSMFSGNTILGDGSVIMILDPNGVAAAIAGEETSESAAEEATVAAKAVDRKQALLLFRAGSKEPRAIPLSALTRLEVVDVDKIERSNGRCMLQYRNGLAPIVTTLADVRAEGKQSILIFSDGERDAGLAVDEIVDIVEADVNVELSSTGSGAMGSAVVDGRATEILDIGHLMSDVFRNWFAKKQRTTRRSRVLLVDDSPFFRTMMAPLIRAAGYEVTEAPNAEAALRLMKEEGCVFELILSDIQMPGMDGRAFAKAVKADPQWKSTPVVGLTSEDDGDDVGYFDLLATKFDREVLIEAIRTRLTSTERAA